MLPLSGIRDFVASHTQRMPLSEKAEAFPAMTPNLNSEHDMRDYYADRPDLTVASTMPENPRTTGRDKAHHQCLKSRP